jgi:hypothetical protein
MLFGSQTGSESELDRAKRATHWSHVLIALAVCAILVVALVFEISDIGPQERGPLAHRMAAPSTR